VGKLIHGGGGEMLLLQPLVEKPRKFIQELKYLKIELV
jgi:hypothetical protein